jgi:hypothetical protein
MANDCFKKFKDIHKGKSAILFGTGPTLDEYKNGDRFIKIGTNEIIYKPFMMDYYFIGDVGSEKRGYKSDPDIYNNYRPVIEKFYRKGWSKVKGMPDGLDAVYYDCTSRINQGGHFYKDIVKGMGVYASISMEALQFILYTGISKLYLIGHDCNYSNGSFHSEECKGQDSKQMINVWKKAKSFMDKEYPEVQVRIVNPVSLTIFEECKQEDMT